MGVRSRMRQANWLAELQAVLAVGAVAALAGVLAATVRAAFGGSVAFTVPTATVDGLETLVRGSLWTGTGVELGGEVDLMATDPTAGQRLAALLTHLPSYLVALTVLVLLWRIVRTCRREDPFSPAVARRLIRLGVVALAGGLLADAVQLVATYLGSATVLDGSAAASYRYSWWWLLIGFGFLAVGEIVKRGADLRAELDTVV